MHGCSWRRRSLHHAVAYTSRSKQRSSCVGLGLCLRAADLHATGTSMLRWGLRSLLRQTSSTDPCAGAWAVVGVGILETTTALVLRAFALRLELVGFVSVMTVTILSEVVALTNSAATNASNALAVVGAVLQVCLILYGVVEHLLLRHKMTRVLTSMPSSATNVLLDLRRFSSQRTVLSHADETMRNHTALVYMIEMVCQKQQCQRRATDVVGDAA